MVAVCSDGVHFSGRDDKGYGFCNPPVRYHFEFKTNFSMGAL